MNRKNTPDIMENLMGVAKLDREPENNKELKHESAPMQSIQKTQPEQIHHIAVELESNKAVVDIKKEKTTFNLSLDTLDLLEDAWIKLRKKMKGEQRITKTLIVEKAIEIVLKEFDSNNEMSNLYKSLKI